jgi:hypothetical protein
MIDRRCRHKSQAKQCERIDIDTVFDREPVGLRPPHEKTPVAFDAQQIGQHFALIGDFVDVTAAPTARDLVASCCYDCLTLFEQTYFHF